MFDKLKKISIIEIKMGIKLKKQLLSFELDKNKQTKLRKYVIILTLFLIILLATTLRFSGIDWGIPHPPVWRNYLQDEAWVLYVVLQMVPAKFDFNPHNFVNPSLHFYTMLGALEISAIFSYLKNFHLPIYVNPLGENESFQKLHEYAKMFKVGRILTMLEGTLTILLVFFIGTHLYGSIIGLIAASFMAVVPPHVYHSHFLVYDQATVFWLALAFWWLTTNVFVRRKPLWYIITGILIGFAVGVKYTNVFLFFAFWIKEWCSLKDFKKGRKFNLRELVGLIFSKNSLITIGVSFVTFFITTPYALLSPHEFLIGDARGWGGIFGERGLFFYMNFPPSLTKPFLVGTYHMFRLPLFLVAMIGFILLFIRRKKGEIMLLSFIIPYYLTLIYHASPHARHYIPLAPFLTISAALVVTRAPQPFKKLKNQLKILISVLLFVIPFIFSLNFSAGQVTRMQFKDTRDECREWINREISPADTIGLASFFPWAYTPAIEKSHANLMVTGYNYDRLSYFKPKYFLITQYEFQDLRQNMESQFTAEIFLERLFSQYEYKIVKTFSRQYRGFLFNYSPNFPSMEWDAVSPVIYIFKRK